MESHDRYLGKELEILDFPLGSPEETLQQAFANGIIDDDRWMKMLRVRNQLAMIMAEPLRENSFKILLGYTIHCLRNEKRTLKNITDKIFVLMAIGGLC